MKKIIGILLVIGASLVLVGCVDTVRGQGELIARDFDVETFSEVNVGGSFYVIWRESDEFTVTVYMQENLFNNLVVEVQNNTLRVRTTGSTTFTNQNRPRLYVYAPTIEAVNFSGSTTAENWDTINGTSFSANISGSATLDIVLHVQSVEIDSSGSGRFTLTGTTDILDVSSSGASRIHADQLRANTANINISGSGQAYVNVVDILDVRVSGSGTVRYSGNPQISQNISGSGRVIAE